MNKPANLPSKKPEPANPLLNAAIIGAVALAVLPAALFGAVRYVQSRTAVSVESVEVEETKPKRLSVAERRAQRLEAHKAKEAKVQNTYPQITMEKVDPYYNGFETDYDAGMGFNNGPGMMPPPYMGGPGMMPPPYMGNFNRDTRMPNGDMGFDDRFGGRGGFGGGPRGGF